MFKNLARHFVLGTVVAMTAIGAATPTVAQDLRPKTLCWGEARVTCMNGQWQALGYLGESECRMLVEEECKRAIGDPPAPGGGCYLGGMICIRP